MNGRSVLYAALDGLADRVVVNGTTVDDAIDVSGDPTEVKVSGLAPTTVAIFYPDLSDRLEINTFAGSDYVISIGLAANAVQLFVDGVLVPDASSSARNQSKGTR